MNAHHAEVIAVRTELGSTLCFEFPELPETLASMVAGESQPARLTATLPENYSTEGTFPLLVFLLPYSRGEVHTRTRVLIGWRDFICVHMPTFKLDYDRNEPCRGILVSMDDFQTVSHVYRVMLQKLFDSVPNIDFERSAMGGFSNGGLTTAMLLAGQDEFILHHFRSFFFVEGANPLAANVLHKPAMRRNRFLVMRGDDFNGAAVREAEFLLDRALALVATEYQLDFTFVVMRGVKHEFPEEYEAQLGHWLRGEKLLSTDMGESCFNKS